MATIFEEGIVPFRQFVASLNSGRAELTIALSEETGASCADCPSYQAAFSIENETGVAIPYQYKWGEKGHWHNTRLESGRVNTHSWPLGEDKNAKIHAPFVTFRQDRR